jgi:hypothetical protein
MTKRNRKSRNLGRAGAIAFFVLLAAGSALALGSDGGPADRTRIRREARRMIEIRTMGIFGQNYAGADWSLVAADLAAHPEGAGNPAVLSIPLSLGNVYLNWYEVAHDRTNLDRAIQMFEWVTSNHGLWGHRDGSGSVVGYLDLSVSRLGAECDVGGFESRIDELWQAARVITAEEADAVAPSQPCSPIYALGACPLAILPVPGDEEAASRASLLAAASNFLAEDSRAEAWGQNALELAGEFSASVCQSPEIQLALAQAALAYRLAGGDVPAGFPAVSGTRPTGPAAFKCSSPARYYETTQPVAVVTPGESLDLAIRDSRVVADHLSETLLWLFPPGSQCETIEEGTVGPHF